MGKACENHQKMYYRGSNTFLCTLFFEKDKERRESSQLNHQETAGRYQRREWEKNDKREWEWVIEREKWLKERARKRKEWERRKSLWYLGHAGRPAERPRSSLQQRWHALPPPGHIKMFQYKWYLPVLRIRFVEKQIRILLNFLCNIFSSD